MGLPKVTTTITALSNGEKFFEAVLLVGTRATDSMVPAPELEKIGVTALESVGIMVDPASKTLRRLPAIPLK